MKTLTYILIMLLGMNWISNMAELMPGKSAPSPCITSMLSSREAFEEKTIFLTQDADEKSQDISHDCNAGKCRFGNCSHGLARMLSYGIVLITLNTEGSITPYLFVMQYGASFSLIRPPILG